MATAAMVMKGMGRLFGGGTLAGRADAQLLESFLADRDESAFAALVARHGPMVLATCRAVLRDPAAADDAFQATFLVLARKAGLGPRPRRAGGLAPSGRLSGRGPGRTGRGKATGRGAKGGGDEGHASTVGTRIRDDLRAAIHAEVERLPESLRLPVVLCDLRGPDPRAGRRGAEVDRVDGPRPAGAGPGEAPAPADPCAGWPRRSGLGRRRRWRPSRPRRSRRRWRS